MIEETYDIKVPKQSVKLYFHLVMVCLQKIVLYQWSRAGEDLELGMIMSAIE